jgi:hypothetical protein
MIEFWIPGEFTTLHPYIDAERSNRFQASKIKKAETARAKQEMIFVPAVDKYPIRICYEWHCKNKRTDPGNIAFAQKFIEDGLVVAGVISDDGWDEIAGGFDHRFVISGDVGVNVKIYENGEYQTIPYNSKFGGLFAKVKRE